MNIRLALFPWDKSLSSSPCISSLLFVSQIPSLSLKMAGASWLIFELPLLPPQPCWYRELLPSFLKPALGAMWPGSQASEEAASLLGTSEASSATRNQFFFSWFFSFSIIMQQCLKAGMHHILYSFFSLWIQCAFSLLNLAYLPLFFSPVLGIKFRASSMLTQSYMLALHLIFLKCWRLNLGPYIYP